MSVQGADADDLTPKQEARRNQVLDAAAKCFVEYGFHAAGMSRIAETAGMSVGHIYHYFANKDAIITAITEREMSYSSDKIDSFTKIAAEDMLSELIERSDEGFLKQTDPFNSILHFEILAESERNGAVADIVRRHDRLARETMTAILRDTLNLPDPDARTEMIFTLFGGLSSRVVRNPELDRDALLAQLKTALQAILQP